MRCPITVWCGEAVLLASSDGVKHLGAATAVAEARVKRVCSAGATRTHSGCYRGWGSMSNRPPPRAQEPAMFDRGTSGRFLRTLSPKIRPRNQGLVLAHDRGQPRTAKKIFPACCAATCAPSPFPQLTTLTNEHQRSDGGTRSNTHEMMSCTPEYLSCIHQIHEKPNTLVKKGVREFERGTRGRFLRKVVPRHGGGGTP